MTKAVLIPVHGVPHSIDINSLSDCQKAVGGYIEHVDVVIDGKLQSMYLNEEGKLQELDYNHLATRLSGLMPFDYIAGNAYLIGPADGEGEDTDVDPGIARRLIEGFQNQ